MTFRDINALTYDIVYDKQYASLVRAVSNYIRKHTTSFIYTLVKSLI